MPRIEQTVAMKSIAEIFRSTTAAPSASVLPTTCPPLTPAPASTVDHAFILRDPPEKFVARLQPAVVVKGQEHEALANPEQEIVESYGGKLLFTSGDTRFSLIDLLQKELQQASHSNIAKPRDYPNRHGFSFQDLTAVIARFPTLKVVVIGDLIVDEYINCQPLGMSQEDPTLVVAPIMGERFIGGAAIVAAHAQGLGAQVSYFCVAGKDDTAISRLLSMGLALQGAVRRRDDCVILVSVPGLGLNQKDAPPAAIQRLGDAGLPTGRPQPVAYPDDTEPIDRDLADQARERRVDRCTMKKGIEHRTDEGGRREERPMRSRRRIRFVQPERIVVAGTVSEMPDRIGRRYGVPVWPLDDLTPVEEQRLFVEEVDPVVHPSRSQRLPSETPGVAARSAFRLVPL